MASHIQRFRRSSVKMSKYYTLKYLPTFGNPTGLFCLLQSIPHGRKSDQTFFFFSRYRGKKHRFCWGGGLSEETMLVESTIYQVDV